MSKRYVSAGVGFFVITSALLLLLLALVFLSQGRQENLAVSFLDVGQGDATLISTPTGNQVLIDGGRAGSVDRPLSAQLPFFDRSLDVVVATHADSDHIGGLVSVLENYDVENVVLPAESASTSAYAALERAAESEQKEGAEVIRLSRGSVLDLGGGAYILTLFPLAGAPVGDTNDSSLVVKLVYGDTSALFSGDSPQSIEEFLALSDGELFAANILQVGHHGSDTSSSYPFLSAVSPQFAVVSAGADNPFGHPDPAVLERLDGVGAETLCTCDLGTVKFISDGETVRRLQ